MKTTKTVIYWMPRALCILAILFICLFATDAFAPGLTIWQQLGGFIMHMIPSFILTGILLIAWKWELIGGILFALIGLGLSPFIYMLNYNRNHFSVGNSLLVVLITTIPSFLIGILFIISSRKNKK